MRSPFEADVLVEGFRPGVLAAMGLDPHELLAEHPDLVIASISGFGQDDDLRARPAYDQIVQGMSGAMAISLSSSTVATIGQ